MIKSIGYNVVKYSTLVPEKILETILLWLVQDKVEPVLKISRRAKRATIDGHSGTGRGVMLDSIY